MTLYFFDASKDKGSVCIIETKKSNGAMKCRVIQTNYPKNETSFGWWDLQKDTEELWKSHKYVTVIQKKDISTYAVIVKLSKKW